MDTATLDLIRTVIQVVAFAIGGAVGLLWMVRKGYFQLQRETVETYRDALAAMEEKVAELEARVCHLEQKNEELVGELEGKELVIAELVREISESGMCRRAWKCPDREIPLSRRRPHSEPVNKGDIE